MSKREDNVHPGEMLRDDFLARRGITPYRLAKDTGLAYSRVEAILKGRRSITAETALRLARYFNVESHYWLALQAAYDLEEALTPELQADLARIVPQPAAPDPEEAG
jgi:addiction module HigA family antidote